MIRVEPLTRSAFLVRWAVAVAGAVGAGAVGPFVGRALAQGNDVEILQFALTLEYLQSEFYARALEELDAGPEVRALTAELADHESQHVEALIATIQTMGGTPVDRPRLDFGKVYATTGAYLRRSNLFEDTAVSAYNGAAPLIEDPAVLAAAGRIVQVEARHAALVRLQRGMSPAPQPFDIASPEKEVRRAMKRFIR